MLQSDSADGASKTVSPKVKQANYGPFTSARLAKRLQQSSRHLPAGFAR